MTMRVEDPDNPINAAFRGRDFQIADQAFQLQEPVLRDRLHVLLSLDAEKTGLAPRRILPGRKQDMDFPMSWVRRHGKGRVFYTGLGHGPDVFSKPACSNTCWPASSMRSGILRLTTRPMPLEGVESPSSVQVSAHEHPESCGNQQHAADPRAVHAERRQFFECDKCRQRRDDGQVHHAAGKQQQHQRPAAAHAIGAVLEAHTERTGQSSAPAAHQESKRGLARPQAGVLERRQLIHARDEQQRRTDPGLVASIIGETSRSVASTR